MTPFLRHALIALVVVVTLTGCGQTYEETKRLSRQQRIEAMRRDSAAFKVAVMPTIDCLPLWVAEEYHLFDSIRGGVRLKHFNAQMDCDTAIMRGRVEGVVTDLVRASNINKQLPLRYVAQTGAYWQLFANKAARIHQLKQLDDKMVAMTRLSVTDQLCDAVVDTAHLDAERLFRVQINDVHVRLSMVLNNEIDALFLAEPQASVARMAGHRLLLDTRRQDYWPGVMAFNEKEMKRPERQQQLTLFIKAYNQACDTVSKYGVRHFSTLIQRRCDIPAAVADSLPLDMRFQHAAAPRQKDIDRAKQWLERH